MADDQGCGWHRLGWPAEALQRQGYDVVLVPPKERQLLVSMNPTGEIVHVAYPPDADVIWMQRVTHRHLIGVLRFLRNHANIATIVDVDDLLSSIAPANPAWVALHPKSEQADHSWRNLATACREATMVSCSTSALLPHYAAHGRGRVIPNLLAEHYFGHERQDSDAIAWPGTMHSHPDDPQVTRGAVGRLVREGASFRVVGWPDGTGRAFGLEADPPGTDPVPLLDWPAAVATIGVGVAPLADTAFNAAKSHLKPLEMAACGVPFVASPRREYAAFHAEGAGLLAGDKGKSWYKALRQLTSSATMRAELSETGRVVAERFRLEREAWRWAELFEDALALQRKTTPVRA
jgi:hypothetical protein